MNEEYIQGFKCGQGIGFQLGKLSGIISVHIGRTEMSVYVDNYNAKFGGMTMCHLMADTLDELQAMADNIGVDRKWLQDDIKKAPHYDVCLSKKQLAIQFGARAITCQEMAKIRHQILTRK